MYQYHGFGLNIASEIEMPELYPCNFDRTDVTIKTGVVPQQLDGENVVKRAFSLIGANEYTLQVKNVSRYYAGYGHTVIVEPCTSADDRSIRVFLLGTIMAAILYQRGSIPLHASAIIKNDKLVLFAGHSGVGKSTLLAQLATRNYTVFTDDVCVLQKDSTTNTVFGTASYPTIKLWEDTINRIGNNTFSKDFRLRSQISKYGQFFHDSFDIRTLPVGKILILSADNTVKEIGYKTIDAMQAFKRVERQAYRYRFATGEKLRSLHFSLMSSLANAVPVIETFRPQGGTEIGEFSDMIETLL